MDFICTNCGAFDNSEDFICSNCHIQIDKNEYAELIDYSKRAVLYGYTYRIEYEHQIAKQGEINVKYSLVTPNTSYEWLAVAALSGLVGSYATTLVNYIAKKILNLLTEKSKQHPLNNEETKMITFLSDNNQLSKFTIYIKNYYDGLPKVDKRVEEAIIEEEFAHTASEDMKGEFEKLIDYVKLENKEKVNEIFLNIAKAAGKKRKNKPSKEQTKQLFKLLKTELKQEKKIRKKKRGK
jgi:hypothetical protein